MPVAFDLHSYLRIYDRKIAYSLKKAPNTFPCPITLLSANMFQLEADVNSDGFVNFLDISPFIQLLSGLQ